jgi:hypothetical protein
MSSSWRFVKTTFPVASAFYLRVIENSAELAMAYCQCESRFAASENCHENSVAAITLKQISASVRKSSHFFS